MSLYNKNSLRSDREETKKRSSIQMKQNISNYFTSVNTKNKFKKIASLNDKKTEIIKDNKREEYFKDFEKKSKAKRSLLYLLNIRSKGKFCPQIIDYFNKIKHSNKKEEQLKERKESKVINNNEINNFLINNNFDNNNNNNNIPNIRSKFYSYKTAKNEISNKESEIKEIKANFNENNNLINENNELDFDIKNIDNIIDNRELTEMNNENVKLESHERIETNPGNIIMLKEIGTNNNIKKSIINNKSRKKLYKKNIKRDKIDTIYNEQRNNLQKFGNYHLSLRTAIQSSLAKKKLIHKKK